MAASRCGEEDLLKFKPNIRMGKKGDLNNFECGMVVGARQPGLSISKTADLPGFSHTPSLRFTENGREKYPVSGSRVDENDLLMSEVRGE